LGDTGAETGILKATKHFPLGIVLSGSTSHKKNNQKKNASNLHRTLQGQRLNAFAGLARLLQPLG
jgi:hypothetical protein